MDAVSWAITRLVMPALGPKQRVPVRKQMLLGAVVDRIAPAVGKGSACLAIVISLDAIHHSSSVVHHDMQRNSVSPCYHVTPFVSHLGWQV